MEVLYHWATPLSLGVLFVNYIYLCRRVCMHVCVCVCVHAHMLYSASMEGRGQLVGSVLFHHVGIGE